MFGLSRNTTWAWVFLAALASGCTSTSLSRAPVEDAGRASQTQTAGPGQHVVRRGETLSAIARQHGQSWQNIARWNGLNNPNVIEVGQVLRIAPPAGVSSPVAAGTVVAASPSKPVASAPATTAPRTRAAPAAASNTAPSTPPASAGNVQFIWPAQGQVINRFGEAKSKGIGIAGNAGDAVLAAADGRVVYSGAGLRGYGNLIIVKHNDTFLTAYAHNRTLLVKEDESVKKGQKIAEMGSSDADRVKLHFEVRRSGKPVDPLSYLPKR